MIMTAEITMYPFQEDFVPAIKAFIDKLADSNKLQIDTYPTCTVLVGEYESIMDVLKEAMAWSYKETGQAVFVSKFIPGYEAD
jgi:uncharacterized protein YqgV (UPF0045/DUF77 family)